MAGTRSYGWVSLLVLVLVLAIVGTDAETLPQAVADKFGAKCLNGQPPNFELQLNSSSTKWVLFLEGGGW